MALDLKNLEHTRNYGTANNYFYNLCKDIEASSGLTWPPALVEKLQNAHRVLSLYQEKKTTHLQVGDAMASVGLAFYQWVQSTHNRLAIEAVKDVAEDPLGSTKHEEAVIPPPREVTQPAFGRRKK